MRATALTTIVAGIAAGIAALTAAAEIDPTRTDVCTLVPGAAVARAVGGRLIEAKEFPKTGSSARCRYFVAVPGSKTPQSAFVVWLYPAAEFSELRAVQDRPVEAVAGLGDAAFVAVDADTGRLNLYAVAEGMAAIEVTGDDAGEVRAVAAAALALLRPGAVGVR